jgi:hypothetical protein
VTSGRPSGAKYKLLKVPCRLLRSRVRPSQTSSKTKTLLLESKAASVPRSARRVASRPSRPWCTVVGPRRSPDRGPRRGRLVACAPHGTAAQPAYLCTTPHDGDTLICRDERDCGRGFLSGVVWPAPGAAGAGSAPDVSPCFLCVVWLVRVRRAAWFLRVLQEMLVLRDIPEVPGRLMGDGRAVCP